MKLFLCGGGADIQTVEARKRLNEIIDHSKPCLYIPLAMESQKYDSCFQWINSELRTVDIPSIEMIKSAKELEAKELINYSFLFIGGGNTFKLLKELKTSKAFQKIMEYLTLGGIVFGGSAGAIIFGKDLEACMLDDRNEVGLTETQGFDVLNGISILCHYTNRNAEKNKESKEYLLKISKHKKIIALPEETTLFINDNIIEVIGNKPYYYFENGRIKKSV